MNYEDIPIEESLRSETETDTNLDTPIRIHKYNLENEDLNRFETNSNELGQDVSDYETDDDDDDSGTGSFLIFFKNYLYLPGLSNRYDKFGFDQHSNE